MRCEHPGVQGGDPHPIYLFMYLLLQFLFILFCLFMYLFLSLSHSLSLCIYLYIRICLSMYISIYTCLFFRYGTQCMPAVFCSHLNQPRRLCSIVRLKNALATVESWDFPAARGQAAAGWEVPLPPCNGHCLSSTGLRRWFQLLFEISIVLLRWFEWG